MSTVLGLAWGLVAAWPIARSARRRTIAARARDVTVVSPGRVAARVAAVGQALPVVRIGGALVARRRARRDARRHHRELPVVTDLLGVAIGAGATPPIALELAVRWAPPRTAEVLAAVARARSHGLGLAEALETATSDHAAWSPLVDALLAGDRLGAPIAPALARVAEQQRSELRRAAEAHARRVPVRLLFPLVFLVLPAFGLLTVVPVLVSGISAL